MFRPLLRPLNPIRPSRLCAYLVTGLLPRSEFVLRPLLSVHCFVALEHRDKLCDLARSGFQLLRGSNAMQDRVPIATGQCGEEGCRLRVFIQRSLDVGRHRGFARGRVGRVPSPV